MANNAPRGGRPDVRIEFYEALAEVESAPFWEAVDRASAPRPVTVPHRWRWADLEPLLRRAGDLVDTDEAERRVLMLVNPASHGEKRAVGNLYAGLQLVLPGESARAHRHTANALRFVLAGAGASTIVDGARLDVDQFDLVLTPGWAWHDHVNRGDEPVIWLDALDSPLARALDAWFFEPHADGFQRADEAADTFRPGSPLRYPWSEMSAALDARLASSDSGTATVNYVDPVDGLDVFPTVRCRAMRVATSHRSRTQRRVGAAVYCVIEGEGSARVGHEHFPLTFGDVFCVPSWYPLSIENHSSGSLSLFCYDDEPLLRAVGWNRCVEEIDS